MKTMQFPHLVRLSHTLPRVKKLFDSKAILNSYDFSGVRVMARVEKEYTKLFSPYMQDDMLACGHADTLIALKLLGEKFEYLKIELNTQNAAELKEFTEAVSQHCVNAEQEVHLFYTVAAGYKLPAAKTVFVRRPLPVANARLNERFPRMESLRISPATDLAYLAKAFPALTSIEFTKPFDVDSDEHVREFFRLNPQLRRVVKLPVGTSNGLLKLVNEAVPELQSLQCVRTETAATDETHEQIVFKNVRHFDTDEFASHEQLKAIQFERLDAFTLHTHTEDAATELLEWIVQNGDLESVGILLTAADDQPAMLSYTFMARLVAGLPKLTELTVNWLQQKSFRDIGRLMMDKNTLQTLNVRHDKSSMQPFAKMHQFGWDVQEQNDLRVKQVTFIRVKEATVVVPEEF